MTTMKPMPYLRVILLAFLAAATPSFANEDEGRIVTLSPASITIGRKHPNTYKITTATACTINGRPVALAALKPGMKADVISEADVAKNITVKDDPLKGGSLDSKAKKGK